MICLAMGNIEQGFNVEDLFIMIFKGGRIWNSNLKQLHARWKSIIFIGLF